jgi:hypothetical protein
MTTEETIPVVQRQDPKSAAKAILEAAFARDEEGEEIKAVIAAESIWCYSCGSEKPKAAKHMGFFFVRDPRDRQVFGPGDWYAVYHDAGEAFDCELDDIVCQQCFAETGERRPLRVAFAPSPDRKAGMHFRIQETWMARFAHEVKRSDMAAWLAKKKAKAGPAKEMSHARAK